MSISRLQLRTNIHLCLKDVIDYASSTQDLKMVCFDNFWEGDGHKIGKEKSHEIVIFFYNFSPALVNWGYISKQNIFILLFWTSLVSSCIVGIFWNYWIYIFRWKNYVPKWAQWQAVLVMAPEVLTSSTTPAAAAGTETWTAGTSTASHSTAKCVSGSRNLTQRYVINLFRLSKVIDCRLCIALTWWKKSRWITHLLFDTKYVCQIMQE